MKILVYILILFSMVLGVDLGTTTTSSYSYNNGGNGGYGNGGYGNGNGIGGGIGGSSTYSFDAKDEGRDDNNISTKKIGYEFNLTVFEKDNNNFSGTVYCVLQENDNNISDINKTTWDTDTQKTITIKNIKKISKDSYIYIKWESESSSFFGSSTSSGENNSTDHLSIMPTKYKFNIPDIIYAGVEYNIEINATDDNENNQSYNQTLNDTNDKNSSLIFIHKNSDLEQVKYIKLEFDNNGIANLEDFNISDIGEYTLELNDTNWTNIDEDDTDEVNRTIYGEKNITVYPYSFLFHITHLTTTNSNWLYHSKELNYTIKGSIEAVNEQNQTVKYFDTNEYANDVNISLEFLLNKVMNDEVNLTYILDKEYNLSIENKQYQISFILDNDKFSEGNSSEFSIVFYIQKLNTPISPIDMNITDINATDYEEKEKGNLKIEDNISFYYPKLNTNDISTLYKEINSSVNVIVYDANETDANSRFNDLILIEWYKFNDNFSNIINVTMKSDSNMNSDNIDINLTINNINDGDINITIDNNTTPKTTKGIIHIDTPIYLWYSKFNEDYSYESDSSCINHYCIEYLYQNTSNDSYNVGSGEFIGSEVNTTYENNSSHKGIRVFK